MHAQTPHHIILLDPNASLISILNQQIRDALGMTTHTVSSLDEYITWSETKDSESPHHILYVALDNMTSHDVERLRDLLSPHALICSYTPSFPTGHLPLRATSVSDTYLEKPFSLQGLLKKILDLSSSESNAPTPHQDIHKLASDDSSDDSLRERREQDDSLDEESIFTTSEGPIIVLEHRQESKLGEHKDETSDQHHNDGVQKDTTYPQTPTLYIPSNSPYETFSLWSPSSTQDWSLSQERLLSILDSKAQDRTEYIAFPHHVETSSKEAILPQHTSPKNFKEPQKTRFVHKEPIIPKHHAYEHIWNSISLHPTPQERTKRASMHLSHAYALPKPTHAETLQTLLKNHTQLHPDRVPRMLARIQHTLSPPESFLRMFKEQHHTEIIWVDVHTLHFGARLCIEDNSLRDISLLYAPTQLLQPTSEQLNLSLSSSEHCIETLQRWLNEDDSLHEILESLQPSIHDALQSILKDREGFSIVYNGGKHSDDSFIFQYSI